jgi:hypothetical protein
MNNFARIHWLRVLIGGFLAEVSVIAVVIPVFLLFGSVPCSTPRYRDHW